MREARTYLVLPLIGLLCLVYGLVALGLSDAKQVSAGSPIGQRGSQSVWSLNETDGAKGTFGGSTSASAASPLASGTYLASSWATIIDGVHQPQPKQPFVEIRGASMTRRALVKFDVPQAFDEIVRIAYITFRVDSVDPDRSPLISLYRLQQDWGPVAVTWYSRKPGVAWCGEGAFGCNPHDCAIDIDCGVVDGAKVGPIGSTIVFGSKTPGPKGDSLTAMVQEWLENPNRHNHGILLASNLQDPTVKLGTMEPTAAEAVLTLVTRNAARRVDLLAPTSQWYANESHVITATVRDATGGALADVPVVIDSTSGIITPTIGQTDRNGNVFVTLLAQRAPSTITVTVECDHYRERGLKGETTIRVRAKPAQLQISADMGRPMLGPAPVSHPVLNPVDGIPFTIVVTALNTSGIPMTNLESPIALGLKPPAGSVLQLSPAEIGAAAAVGDHFEVSATLRVRLPNSPGPWPGVRIQASIADLGLCQETSPLTLTRSPFGAVQWNARSPLMVPVVGLTWTLVISDRYQHPFPGVVMDWNVSDPTGTGSTPPLNVTGNPVTDSNGKLHLRADWAQLKPACGRYQVMGSDYWSCWACRLEVHGEAPASDLWWGHGDLTIPVEPLLLYIGGRLALPLTYSAFTPADLTGSKIDIRYTGDYVDGLPELLADIRLQNRQGVFTATDTLVTMTLGAASELVPVLPLPAGVSYDGLTGELVWMAGDIGGGGCASLAIALRPVQTCTVASVIGVTVSSPSAAPWLLEFPQSLPAYLPSYEFADDEGWVLGKAPAGCKDATWNVSIVETLAGEQACLGGEKTLALGSAPPSGEDGDCYCNGSTIWAEKPITICPTARYLELVFHPYSYDSRSTDTFTVSVRSSGSVSTLFQWTAADGAGSLDRGCIRERVLLPAALAVSEGEIAATLRCQLARDTQWYATWVYVGQLAFTP